MHSIKERPVVVNGQIVIRPIMVVALTYDHRLLDGREAVTFLGKFFRSSRSQSIWDSNYFLLAVKVRDYLEDPRKMLLV
jgi:2-oxoglutarate dehydrogenase E2 component (dihydrolipoamide succinyltransferase)